MKSRLTSGNSTAASPPRDVSSDSEGTEIPLKNYVTLEIKFH